MPETPFPEAETAFPEVHTDPAFPEAVEGQQDAFPEAAQQDAKQDQTLSAQAPSVQSHKEGVQDFGNHVGKDAWEDLKKTIGGVLMAPVQGYKEIYKLYREANLNRTTGVGRPDLDAIKDAYSTQFSQMGDGMVNSWSKWYKPEGWEEDPDNPGHYRRTGGSVVGMIGRKFYHEPTSAILDAATAVDLGGGVVGGLGKVTGNAKMVQAADAIRSAPARFIEKGWDGAKRLMGQNPEAKRLTLDIQDAERSGVTPKVNADLNEINEPWRAATPEERQLAHDMNKNGLTQEEAEAIADQDGAFRAADAYKDYVENVRQPTLKDFNLPDFSDEVMHNRLVKQYAKARYGKSNLSASEFEAMEEEMSQLARQPVYIPAREELQSGLPLEDAFTMTNLPPGKKVGFLEKYRGTPIEDDPTEYIPRVVKSFRNTEADLLIGNRLLQEPTLIRSGMEGEENALKGISTSGVMKKYLDNGEKAKAVYFRELEAQYGTEEATRLIYEDAGIQERLAATTDIIADPTLKRLLQQEFYLRGVRNKFVQIYDWLNHLVKTTATRLNPRYYAGVTVGQAMMSLFSGTLPQWGMRAREMEDFLPTQAQHVALEGGVGQKLLNAIDVHDAMTAGTKSGMITRFAARRMSQASDLGFSSTKAVNDALPEVLQADRNLGDFQVARQQLHERIVQQAGQLTGIDAEMNRLTQMPVKPPDYFQQMARLRAEKNMAVGELEMKAIDAGALSEQIPGFQQYAELLRPAVREANAYLGSSNALTPIEKYIWRRIVPYYTFNKTITMLAFRLPFIAPTSAFMWSRLSAELNRMTTDPELGDRMHGYFPMWIRQNGDTVWGNVSGLSHAGGLGLSHVGGVPVPNMLNPVKANHFVALGYRLLGGKTDFDIKTVPFGTDEMFVNGHNGEVLRLDENGKPVVEIPQLPLLKGIAHMFPWVQYAEHVIQRYQQTTEGWLLNPQAIKKPDGTYKYPYEMIQALPQMFGPKVMIANRDDLIAQRHLHEAGIINEIKKAIPKAGPDEREMLIQGLKDYVQGLGH